MLKVKIDELKRMMFECFNTYNKKVVEIKVANIDKKREVTDILLSFTIGENTLTRYIYVFKVGS